MANDALNPEIYDVNFTGEEFKSYLRELAPGELTGKRTAQEGCDEVCHEILTNQAEWGGKAGVTPEDAEELVTIIARMKRIDQFIQPVRKFLQMLIETRYLFDDIKQRLIFNIAQSVDRRGKLYPELFAKYQVTRQYRSVNAKKARKTRLKNEAEKQEAKPASSETKPPSPEAKPLSPKEGAQPLPS